MLFIKILLSLSDSHYFLSKVLSDPQKKAVYDKYGSAGLTGANGGGRSSASASDLARKKS
jgi:hypothetical protein